MSLLRDLLAALKKPADVGRGLALDEADIYAARVLAGGSVVAPAPIVGSPEASGWRAATAITADPAPLGEVHVEPGAGYASPPVELAGALRYAVMRLRAACLDGHGQVRLSWLPERRGIVAEGGSTTFGVAADGADRTYVVDLWQSDDARLWRGKPGRVHLSFEPLDRAGSARVLLLAFLPDGWRADGAPPAPDAVALGRRGRAARRGLDRAARGLALGAQRWVALERDVAWTRAWLVSALEDSGIVVERIEASPADTRVLLRRVAPGRRRGVDIVVRNLRDRAAALATVRSVARHARGDYRLVIVDDAGDAALRETLDAFAAKCERAVVLGSGDIDHGGNRDVVLIEGGARVFRGFLQGLQACVRSDDATGVACALCGVDAPAGTSDKKLAALARRASRRMRPELDQAHGACVYVRAEVLAQGSGDPRERARAAGFRIRLADDVLVSHPGGALEIGASIRDELSWHAERASSARAPAVMMLLSASLLEQPGGAPARAVRDLVEGLALPRVIVAHPGEGGIEIAEVRDGDLARAGYHRISRRRNPERALTRVLDLFRVGHVHVHDATAWSLSAQRALVRARRPYTITLHDVHGQADEQRVWLRRWIDGADYVVVPSEDARAWVDNVDQLLVLSRGDDQHAWLAAHRELYARISPRVATGRLRRREYHALADSRR